MEYFARFLNLVIASAIEQQETIFWLWDATHYTRCYVRPLAPKYSLTPLTEFVF